LPDAAAGAALLIMLNVPVTDSHRAAAARLLDAAARGVPCAPVRGLLAAATVDDAYAVQSLVHEATGTGRRRLGRKIGLTSRTVQEQMGVDQPDFGVLYADMAFGDGEPLPADRLLQPRIEAEVAFVLARDLPERPVVSSDVIRATDFVVAAIEIVDSRIADWDISIVDTVADNASSGLFVLGGRPRRLCDIVDLRSVHMQVTNGDEVVSEGDGAACLGHPLNAVVWLANELARRGEPLRAGEVVLSGALGPLAVAAPGRRYEATLEGLGSVRANFGAT
jgi:2-keto-4-pentenoate hydratase